MPQTRLDANRPYFPSELVGTWTLVSSSLILAACAYLTRAAVPRVMASLAGGVAFAILNVAWDVVAHRSGLWWYPGTGGRGYGLVEWYASAGLAFAGVGLIGWRVHRRWRIRGLLVFVPSFALYCVLRDFVVSTTVARELIRFGPGVVPWLADWTAALSLTAVGLAVQAALRGDPRAASEIRGR